MIELINSKKLLDDNYEIREYDIENELVRALISKECIQSMIYLDKNKREKLCLDYFCYYNIPIDLNINGTDYLMLGGGAISYPHYYFSKYVDKKMDIVEIDVKCIDYAKKYFYLDELLENNKGRLNIIIDDAINYISYTDKKYDYLLIDLFDGKEPIKNIYSEENVNNLRKTLKSNGIIVINYIFTNYFEKETLNKIIQIMNNYKIISNKKNFDKLNNRGNILIILSNNEIKIPNTYEYIEMDELLKK